MGKVVKLADAEQRARGGGARARRAARGRRARRSSSGGGGFTGGVYEIGALRALDLLVDEPDRQRVRRLRRHSAGSFVAALVANGITPEEMMRVVNQQVPTPFRDIDLGQLLRPNLVEFARKGALLPLPPGEGRPRPRAPARAASA